MAQISPKFWLFATLILLGVIVAYVFVILRAPPEVLEIPEVPEVITPELESIEQLEEITKEEPLPPPEEEAEIILSLEYEHVKGNPDAPISIVGFFSFQQDYSKFAYEALSEFIEQNPDKVNLVYRHYALTKYPLAMPAAIVSECMYEEGGDEAFWFFVDKVYTEDFTEDDFIRWAEELDLEVEVIEDCLKYEWDVEGLRDKMYEGWQWGLRAAPHVFFIRWDTGEIRSIGGARGTQFLQRLQDEMSK